MKAIGKIIKNRVKGSTLGQMAPSTRENLNKIRRMVMEFLYGRTVINIKVIGNKIKDVEKVRYFVQMGKNIMVNGWMISRMDVEPITGHKIVDMRVNGKMEKCMAQALK